MILEKFIALTFISYDSESKSAYYNTKYYEYDLITISKQGQKIISFTFLSTFHVYQKSKNL